MIKSKSDRGVTAFCVLFMLVFCVFTLYPYLNQIAVALNDGADTAFGGITIYPRKPTWVNLQLVFSNDQILGAGVISITRVVLATVGVLIVTSGAAYALTREDMPGKNFFIGFLILPGYVSTGIIPVFLLFRYYGLINNFWVYVIPGLFSFYNTLIVMSFIRSLPKELSESAVIDGANDFQIYKSVIIPLCKPVLATVALWTLVTQWNDWTTTLYYITDRSLYTLQYILMLTVKESETLQSMISEVAVMGGSTENIAVPTSEAVKAATFVVITFPIIAVYPFLQKYFVKGVTIGSVKG